jgi:hypothetical protein
MPILLLNKTEKKHIEYKETLKLTYTVYWAVKSQTSSDPTTTAFGYKIKDPYNPPNYVAISRDLLEYFKPGDTLVHNGKIWIVADLMNKRWRRKVDFLVPIGHKERGTFTYEIP